MQIAPLFRKYCLQLFTIILIYKDLNTQKSSSYGFETWYSKLI
jgi:hypothetical protein